MTQPATAKLSSLVRQLLPSLAVLSRQQILVHCRTFRIRMSRRTIPARGWRCSLGLFRASYGPRRSFSVGGCGYSHSLSCRCDCREKPMNQLTHSDPAEHSALMRLFYRNWRPTRVGRWLIALRAGGPALAYHRGFRPPSKSVAAHRAADVRTRW